jgi:hypothetical protein
MIVAVNGSRNFNSYETFLRAMGNALFLLEKSGDSEFILYSAGPHKVNSMAMEFVNVSERNMKARGLKSKVIKVSPVWVKENMHSLDYFAYFCVSKEPVSYLMDLADSKEILAQVYRP